MSDNVPAWAWDLLIAALDYEDVHHADHPCMSSVLNAIPAEVRYTARSIDEYRRDTHERDATKIREAIAAQLDKAAQEEQRQHQQYGDRGMLIATWQAAAEIARGGSDD